MMRSVSGADEVEGWLATGEIEASLEPAGEAI
jgi:hypothetical protein